RPFSIGVIGSYEVFNFLRDTSFMNQIMKVTAIKYVGYPYTDTRREDLKDDEKKYYDTFLDQLTNAPWSNGRITEKPVALIATKEPAEHIFLAPNTFFILGSDSLY